MKKIGIILMFCMLCGVALGQPARSVLDKVSAVISNKGGVSANFKISSSSYGNANGKIYIKGRQFHATTASAIIWFNGKTQWTYMKHNNEVNVNNPTEAELQAINPYNFINMYRSGFSYGMKTIGGNYQVHLKATKKSRQIQEMYILVNKSTYVPSQIKMRQGSRWSTITISNFKKANLSNSIFRFNSKDYPKAELIDLR